MLYESANCYVKTNGKNVSVKMTKLATYKTTSHTRTTVPLADIPPHTSPTP